MLLSPSEFLREAIRISKLSYGHIGFDFETTGLNPYKYDRATIMGFTDEKGNKKSLSVRCAPLDALEIFFSNLNLKYCAHNIPFEMSFLRVQFSIRIWGVLWDTAIMARVEYNNHMKYDLQSCAKRIGSSKHPPMLEWLKKKGNKGRHAGAPEEILVPYVEQDAWLSWELARRQMIEFKHRDVSSHVRAKKVVALECDTIRPLFEMTHYGLLVDVNYCERALAYEKDRIKRGKEAFKDLTGVEFVASRKCLEPIFISQGIPYGRTELGNASFTESAIEASKSHPIVRAILDIRTAEKRASSYWENFLELEHNGIIHPSIHQIGAKTGRMSISQPSCQNWSTDDDDPEFPIRRAFIARENCWIVSLDYSAMELRMICDQANDRGMIKAILEGTDFHQQTADAAGVPRSLAKNGRFAKLYGAGVPKVAETLGVSRETARAVCEAIDESSPRVSAYARELIQSAETSPFGYDYSGRRFYYDPGHSYRNSNYVIQGGCGEVLRLAIQSTERILRTGRMSEESQILLPIHDELVLNLDDGDLCLIPKIKQAMIDAYQPFNGLPMDVSIHIGKNFHELEAYV